MIKESDQFSICTLKTNLPTIILVPHPGNMTSGYAFRNRPFERNPTTWVPTAPMRNGECLPPVRTCTLFSRTPTSKCGCGLLGQSPDCNPDFLRHLFSLGKLHIQNKKAWFLEAKMRKKRTFFFFSPYRILFWSSDIKRHDRLFRLLHPSNLDFRLKP